MTDEAITAPAATVETPAAVTTAAPATSEPHWSGFSDPVDIGYLDNKGWKSPADIGKVVKSYREAERMLGISKANPERLLVMPSDFENKDEVDSFYSKLGRPSEAAGYSFLKNEAFDKDIAAKLSETFHAKGLNDAQATEALTAFSEISSVKKAEYDQQVSEMTEREIDETKKEWGNALQQNLLLGNQASDALGLDENDLKNLEAALGPKKLLNMLADVGRKMGEAPALGLGNNANSFVDTPGQAMAKMNELKADANFMNALLDESSAGHAAAKAKYNALRDSAFIS